MLEQSGPRSGLLAYGLLDTPPERGFDDVVLLACQLCDVPTALISLLDRDRQWFKARVGFPHCETDLDRSVCRFVVEQEELIEIPDLTADPRTATNPLVVGVPRIRFYAGAPLRTPLGTIGALCVIDDKPRPSGLTGVQRSSLEMLARQVVDVIELRHHAVMLEAAERARALEEQRWRGLFQAMSEGFILARAVRAENGAVVDWRYEEVNQAWERLVDGCAGDAIGRTVRELFPGIEDEWVSDAARAIDTGELVHFTRQLGAAERWYDGIVKPVGDDRFTVTFHEVTARIAAEKRQAGLTALGDLLRDERDIPRMIREATVIIGRALDASRAAYGELDHPIETVSISDGWEARGMPPIAGSYRFEDYGRLRETLLAGDALVITDVLTDQRTANDVEGWLALETRAVINVPVRERGSTVALLLVHHDQPHQWTSEEVAWLQNAADRIEIAIARRRADERQALVNGEIAHRLKNTLAMVQSLAGMTLGRSLPREELARFDERLQALARAHDLLHAGKWHATDLGTLAEGALQSAGVAGRCQVGGPGVRLGASAAMSTALVLHELATNAVKHGSLSVPTGLVRLVWRFEQSPNGRDLVLEWVERNGPLAVPPTRKGFGSRLIGAGLMGTGAADLRYGPDGLSATFRADAERIGRI